ncbi:putative Cyclic nucleotide-binding domain protein 4 [Paraburkholderia ribeironis]|uniref:Putative Cyclic nucleotide-binding domain protein 4 n=1 Tax=Paraburkholderia ribeironis TaxID=1247936 RepID=A0A1N7RZQ7_9BURK|nr:Crp/Fnr family transcriptional regulator [Paraburkholderia ribeironis]SIT40595.1 putative Cyclic nucleotide-binding domain protein 4 [Paraburkholderia ribeironis]
METSSDINWASALNGLHADDIRKIEEFLAQREVPARSPIFFQDEPADALFIIRSGRVRLVRRTEAGEEFTTGVWSSGYVIGLISTFLGEHRLLGAETIERASFHVLRRDALLRCMQTIPQFALNIANLLALLASDSIRRTAPLALEPVEAKLGRVLVKLAVPAQQDSQLDGDVVQGITQDELARMVGASRPWVNRALASYEKRGLIRRHKQFISIPDIKAFKNLWTD